MRTDGGTLLVLDCGTGARALGLDLLDERQLEELRRLAEPVAAELEIRP